MIKINQTIKHENKEEANCFQACVASYFECDLELVPNFILFDNWLERFINFVNSKKGYKTSGFHWGKPPENNKYYISYYIVNEFHGHAVITLNGNVIHDPIGELDKTYNIDGYFNIEKII